MSVVLTEGARHKPEWKHITTTSTTETD